MATVITGSCVSNLSSAALTSSAQNKLTVPSSSRPGPAQYFTCTVLGDGFANQGRSDSADPVGFLKSSRLETKGADLRIAHQQKRLRNLKVIARLKGAELADSPSWCPHSTWNEAYRGFSGRTASDGDSVHRRSQQAWKDGAWRGRRRRENSVVTRAIPLDAYWITAFQAITVAGLMAGFAAVSGVLINIRIEVQAMEEYLELEKKGLLPEEFNIPDEDFDIESPLYIFKTIDFISSGPSRNRPVREEIEPELSPEAELEPASQE